MKHIKSFFSKLKAKMTLKTYQTPLGVTLLMLLGVNVIVICIGACIGLWIDASVYDNAFFEGSFVEAFIGSVKWMISPNSLTTLSVKEHWKMMILAIAIVIVGMVLFSGAIIATVTTALRTFIDIKSRAKGKILLSDHFVILNWNAKVPEMIFNLMRKETQQSIVILSLQNKEYIEGEVKSLVRSNEFKKKAKVNLIIKEGDPLLRNNLDDISIEKASQICIMARDDMRDIDDDGILNSDLFNLKIALRLGSFEINPDCQIVVETNSDETRGQIENLSFTVNTLKRLSLTPISFNRKIGQVIAQSLVSPQLSHIYTALFTYEGAEFYSTSYQGDIESFMKTHSNAIPVCKGAKRFFVLAENEKEIPVLRRKEYSTKRKLKPLDGKEKSGATIFIIGDNSKRQFVVENLEKSQEFGNITFALKHFEKDENEALVEAINNTSGAKKVLILSDDRVEPESYDANVFVTLIQASKSNVDKKNLAFTTELLDSRNLSSIHDFGIKNTIISNKMMSLLLTQICLNPSSKVFFDRILTTAVGNRNNDFDLVVTKASKLVEMDGPLHFESKAELLATFYNTFKGKNLLIGLWRDDQPYFLHREQDKKEDLVVNEDDLFIYFKYVPLKEDMIDETK